MYKSQQGFLFIMGLFVLSVLTTLTAVGLTRSLTELRMVNYSADSAQAFHLAEANLSSAIQAYRTAGPAAFTTAPWTTAGTVSSRTVDGLNIAGASGAVTVSGPASGQPTFDATVTVGSAVRRLYVVGRTTLPTFSHAFYAGKYLKIGSWGLKPVTTDSYDSTLGPYGGANIKSNGSIGTNGGTLDNPYPGVMGIDFQPQSTARINGSLTVAPWINPSISTPPGQIGIASGALCNGNPCSQSTDGTTFTTFIKNPPRDLPPINFPQTLTDLCQGVTPTTIATVSTGVMGLSDGGCYGDITVNGSGEVDIPVGKVSVKSVTIQGDGKFVMGDNVKLYLRGTGVNSYIVNITNTYDADGTEHGGSLLTGHNNEIYGQYGQFWVRSKNGIIPNPNDPTPFTPRDLIIRVVGRDASLDTTTGALSGTSDLAQPFFQGAIYTQHGWLYVKGNYYCSPAAAAALSCYWTPAKDYGAAVSGEYLDPATHGQPTGSPITPNDPLDFHYDESLNGVSLTGAPYFFTILVWRELAPGEAP